MKKQLLLLTAFILMFSTSLIAQEWHIAGNTIGASDFLGGLSGGGNPLRLKTEDAQDIRFYTNAGSGSFNNLRMIILSGGNVGIGLSSPNNLLHLHGGTFQVTNSTTGSTSSDGFQISNNGNHAELNQKESADMRFFTNNTQYMTLDNVGRLGINQSSPSYRLDVTEGSGSSQLRLAFDGTNQTLLQTTNAGYFKFLPSSNRVGINVSPNATLDVYPNSSGDNPLRLRDLYTSTTLEDFLVVDGSGYVKKRNIQNVVSTCATTNQYYVPVFCSTATQIQNSQIYDNGANVGIGTTSFTGTLLEVVDNGSNATPIIASSTGSGSNAITASVTGINSTGVSSTAYTYGIYGVGNGSHWSGASSPLAGVVGAAVGTNNSGTGTQGNVGVYGFVTTAQSTSDNFGIYGLATVDGSGAGTVNNYGVYGTAWNGDNNYAGYFAGNLYASTYLNYPSDELLKTNIQDLTDALTTLEQLQPVSYEYLTDQYPQMHLPSGSQFGFIAQQVEQVLPEATATINVPAVFDNDGNEISPYLEFKAYKPDELIPLAIQGIKELKAMVDEQQQLIEDLQSQIDGCCSGIGMRGNDGSNSSNQQVLVLSVAGHNSIGQSIPNPHKEQCTIPYYIAETTNKAEIVFYDNLGREINRVEIIGRGAGQVTVLTSQLATGLYSYSLLADGLLIDTKKMIKQD